MVITNISRLDDAHAAKDTAGDGIRPHNIARLSKWSSGQPEHVRARFCEHGHYVGFKRSLAYICPDCPET